MSSRARSVVAVALLGLANATCGAFPTDPEGTMTTTVNFKIQPHPIILYQGIAADGPYTPESHPYVQILTGVDESLNVHFATVTSSNYEIREPYLIYNGVGGEVVSLGAVNGLGSITQKPASGWASLASAEPGHGYVLRFKRSKSYATADLPYTYARLYVDDWLMSTSGGILGAKVKYQISF